MTGNVAVLGSANGDLVLSTRLPAPGETVLAKATARAPGGKGANQAAAAARAGAATTMLGAIGRDPDGDALRTELAEAGVNTAMLRTSAEPTGLAVVMVDEAGQNSIVVAAGANATMTSLSRDERSVIADAAVLLCQLEVPLSAVCEAAATGRESGTRVVLNAAPSRSLPDELWSNLDVLVVNELEAADLAGTSGGAAELGNALLQRVPCVVVTLGDEGAWLADRHGTRLHSPAPRVPVVDTTAAGDTFCGVLAATLASSGAGVADALPRAIAAAALSVQRRGAITSTPTAAEIAAALDARS